MSYLARLKAEFSEKRPSDELTKPTKGPSVSFVSASSSSISGIEVANEKAEAGGGPTTEARRLRLLEMLATNPTARYAVLTDAEADAESVTVALAIRGHATCELHIPRDRYDPFLLLDLIERHGATLH